MSRFEINEHSEKRFYHGKINKLIRLYWYFQEGLAQTSNLRTIVYAIIGIAGVAALSEYAINIWIYVVIVLILIPFLTLLGYVWIMRAKKSMEYFMLKYTTTYTKYGMEMQEEQMNDQKELIKLNKEVLTELKKLNENTV